jgi:hypothetical protein
MTGDEYFVRLLHERSDDCGLPFSFLRQCAILSSRENQERGWMQLNVPFRQYSPSPGFRDGT